MLLEEKTLLKNIKKNVLESFIGIFLIILFAIVLLKNPENFIYVAIEIFGYGAIFLGVLDLVFFFKIKKEERIIEKKLQQSALLLSFGIISFFRTEILHDMITILLGGYFLYQNSARLEIAFYLKNSSSKKWLFILICSLINILLALFLIINPLNDQHTNQFISILLITMESILIIQNIMILVGGKDDKKEEP